MRLRPEHDFKLLTSLSSPRDLNDYGFFCGPSGPVCAGQGSASGLVDTTDAKRNFLLHCYIALDYDTLPTSTAESSDNDATYELSGGNIFTGGIERFRCAEVFITVGAKTLPLRGSVTPARRPMRRQHLHCWCQTLPLRGSVVQAKVSSSGFRDTPFQSNMMCDVNTRKELYANVVPSSFQ